MDLINLPLILFILVVVSGLVTLYDYIAFSKPRKLAVDKVEAQFTHLSEDEKKHNEGYQKAVQSVSAEPQYIEISKSFFPLLLVVFLFRSFLIEPFQIPSESMVPTLEVGDFLAVNKFAYGVRLPLIDKKIFDVSDPKRGDVMVFVPPDDPRYYIKRVIGLPGDIVQIRNNVLFLNGEKVPVEFEKMIKPTNPKEWCFKAQGMYRVEKETLGEKSYKTYKCTVAGALGDTPAKKVPEGHYFLMGDNRDNSADSRVWGFEPDEKVVGKAFYIWMHWEKLLSFPSFSRNESL